MNVRSPSDTRQQLSRRLIDSLAGESPDESPRLRCRDFGTEADQQIRYYLYADVVEELVKAATYRSETATAMLLGRFRLDAQGPFVEIDGFDQLEYLYGADLLEGTRSRVEKVIEETDQGGERPERHVVGVYVARPGGEARLDEETARLHLSLFNLPYQPAVVCDGDHRLLGVYGRAPGRAFFNAGFSIVEEAPESLSDSERQRVDDGCSTPNMDFDSEDG